MISNKIKAFYYEFFNIFIIIFINTCAVYILLYNNDINVCTSRYSLTGQIPF